VLAARSLALPPALSERVDACDDDATLLAWTTRAATATHLDSVFDDEPAPVR
jgi:hypothetical protein